MLWRKKAANRCHYFENGRSICFDSEFSRMFRLELHYCIITTDKNCKHQNRKIVTSMRHQNNFYQTNAFERTFWNKNIEARFTEYIHIWWNRARWLHQPKSLNTWFEIHTADSHIQSTKVNWIQEICCESVEFLNFILIKRNQYCIQFIQNRFNFASNFNFIDKLDKLIEE